jgi:hypothetical protein
MTMPPSLVGFDTGTIEIKAVNVKFHNPEHQEKMQVRLTAASGSAKVKKQLSGASDSESGYEAPDSTLLSLPMQTRYHSALVVDARKKGLLRRGTDAMGVVWLRDLIDNHHDGIVKTTLWKADNYDEIKQNYSKPHENILGDKAEAIGEIEVQVVFKPGIADVHEKEMKEDPKTQKSWEEYLIMKREGLRNFIGRSDSHQDNKNPNVFTDNVKEEPRKDASQNKSQGVYSHKDSGLLTNTF